MKNMERWKGEEKKAGEGEARKGGEKKGKKIRRIAVVGQR